MTRRTMLLRAAQAALALLVIAAALRTLGGQWDAVRRTAADVTLDWPPLLASCVVVLATYLVLVAAWRHVVNAMGGRLRYLDAAYIWFVSALARYLGALWQVVALSALAQRMGAAPMTAAAAAVVMTIVNVLTGFGVVLATGGLSAGELGVRSYLAIAAGVLALVLAPVAGPRLAGVASRITGRDVTLPRITPAAVWAAAAGSVVSWFAYGFAFYLLTRAVLGDAPGGWLSYVAVYTAAYLAGLLGLVPAGVAVAEGAMIGAFALAGILPAGEAFVVAIVSRLWRTVLEIIPGLVMVAVRGRPLVGVPGDPGTR